MVLRIDTENSRTLIEQMDLLKNSESKDPILSKIDPKSNEDIKSKESSGYSRMHHRHNRS